MSTAAQDVLDAFERLTQDEQRAVASVILRNAGVLDYAPLDDETLSRIADETFQEYDVCEPAGH